MSHLFILIAFASSFLSLAPQKQLKCKYVDVYSWTRPAGLKEPEINGTQRRTDHLEPGAPAWPHVMECECIRM